MAIQRKSTFLRMLGLIFFSAAWFVIVGGCWYVFMRFELYNCILPINTLEQFSKVQGVFQGFVTLLFGIGPAVVFWYFRDQAKHIDQEHTERDLRIKENNDAWKNFIEYQKIAESSENSEGTRAAAIYALGEYYTRPLESNFPFQVHSFFRYYLNNFWTVQPEYVAYQKERLENQEETNSKDTGPGKLLSAMDQLKSLKIPEYIRAVYKVIQDKSQRISYKQITWLLLGHKYKKNSNLFHFKNELDFNDFNLCNADIEGAELEEAHLEKADIVGTHLEEAHLVRAHLEKANLEEADLKFANLERAHFDFANLYRANLERTNLEGADLKFANLGGANLEKANLEGAYLIVANLEGAELERANLKGVDLGGARLGGANLEGADLKGALLSTALQLDEAFLKDAKYDDSTKFPAGFDPEKAGMIHLS